LIIKQVKLITNLKALNNYLKLPGKNKTKKRFRFCYMLIFLGKIKITNIYRLLPACMVCAMFLNASSMTTCLWVKGISGAFYAGQRTFLAGLSKLLQEIFNPDVPFTKVSDKKACEHCDYIGICHR